MILKMTGVKVTVIGEMCIRDRLSIALALASGVGPEAGIFTAIVAG